MAFSDSVGALLGTYANCISLLKAFGRGREEGGTANSHHDHSHLRKSLRSDRSLVERAYSSKVSESGSRFKKGDARAKTALDRILKRLRTAVTSLLRLSSKKDGLDLDYESLMTLSNASRADAIKAIDSLSRRLASPSRSSVVSSSSTKASSKASPSRHKHKPPSNAEASTTKPKKAGRQENSPSKKPPPTIEEGKTPNRPPKADAARLRKSPPPLALSPPPPPPKSPDSKHQARTPRAVSANPKSPKLAEPNRISILSFASDSTKLGEIPQRKRQSVMRYSAIDPDGDEYNVRPMFPLKPYTVEVRERRFWGLFSRKREP
ncbi:hypothetical protein C8A00DRAFT_45466 [Chaetomidium leptoderma]|uniref:Uncharacterized protein n=1 Tax=Chaetomidium leptoderma TaxID=669021 RepID=A0AAN6ZTH3_9PEZI|nr:hypothetical protein C8A00DRAFT_45466 [Chaetomidium leptoderma]